MEKLEGSGAVSPEKENVVDPAEEMKEEAPMTEEQEEEKGEKSGEEEEDEGDEADDEEEESEGPHALFDEPLVVDGKRQRSTVAPFVPTTSSNRPKAAAYQGGQGVHLGSIDFVKDQIQKHPAVTLKGMYRVLYGRVGKLSNIKKEIREFSGFDFGETDDEYERRLNMMRKMTLPDIRFIKQILGLHQAVDMGSNKDAVIDMLLGFLLNPEDHNRKVLKKRKAQKKESKKDTPSRKPRAKRAKKGSDDEKEESEKEDGDQSDDSTMSEADIGNKSPDSKRKDSDEEDDIPTHAQLVEACKEFIASVDTATTTMKMMLMAISDKFPDDNLLPRRKWEIKEIIRNIVASS